MSEMTPTLRAELDALHAEDGRHARRIERLEADMTEIRETLKRTATKTDIAGLQTHVSMQINGILRDALNAAPMKQSILWGAIVALVTFVSFLLRLKHL